MRGLLVLIVSATLSACGSPDQEPVPVTTDEAQALQKAGEMLDGLETAAPSADASEAGAAVAHTHGLLRVMFSG